MGRGGPHMGQMQLPNADHTVHSGSNGAPKPHGPTLSLHRLLR